MPYEVDSDSSDKGVHLKVIVSDYDGVAERDSLLYLGKWSSDASSNSAPAPINSDGFAQIKTVESVDYIANGSGTIYTDSAGASIPAYASGSPNLAALNITQRSDGDDMLWAFVYNSFIDDIRDRNVGSDDSNDVDAPSATGFAALATPPYRKVVTVDDVATADVDETTYAAPPYTIAERQEMTRQIPNYVGWRDHTEGHRITTTRGDKIEVVAGHSKTIVLGRGQGTVTTDYSGGQVVDVLEAPGNVTSINYRKVPSATTSNGWQWVEEVVKGNVIERFHGTFKEEFYGNQLITLVGHSGTKSVPTSASKPLGHWDVASGFGDEETNYWDSDQGQSFNLARPNVIEKTRATGFFEAQFADYVDIGVVGAGVGIYDYIGCKPDSYTAKVDAATGASYYMPSGVDYSDGSLKPDNIIESIYADNVYSTVHADNWHEYVEVDKYVAYYMGDKNLHINANETWLGNHQEYFLGAHTQLFGALYSTVGIANRFELFVGFEEKMNAGILLNWALRAYELHFEKWKWPVVNVETKFSNISMGIYQNYSCLFENSFEVTHAQVAANLRR